MRNALAKLGGAIRSWTSGPYSIGDPALWGLLNVGNKSDSGVVVNREVALSLSAIWKGVNIIANGCAKAGLHRYRRLGEHGKEKDTAHPTYRLLRSQPNEYMTAFDLWRTSIGHALLGGNAYLPIERQNGATPTAILLSDPEHTWPVRKDKVLWYVTAVDHGDRIEYVKLRAEDVIHIRGFGHDGLCGYSVVHLLRDTVGAAIATRKHATTFFSRGAMLSGILEYPGARPDQPTQDSIRENWDRMYTGVNNANRVAILFGGMKFTQTSVDAQKAQMNETRAADIIDLANLLLLPPHKLGDTSRQGYNSLEMEEKSVAADAFDPWWTAIECECDSKLLTEKEKRTDSHYFRWNRRAALQTDAKAEAETLKIHKDAGAITVDEYRGVIDRGELPYGLGNVIDRPNSNTTLIRLDRPPPDNDANDVAFHRELIKAFAGKNPTSDVFFNLIDAKSLLESAGISTFKGYDEPWLPVIAENGQIVSGNTVTGPDGEIVGGDTVAPEPTENADSNGENPTNTDETDANLDENGRKFRAFVARERASRLAQVTATRDAMADALDRMVKRVGQSAERAAKSPPNYNRAIENLRTEHAGVFLKAIGPSVGLVRALGGDTDPVERLFFAEISSALLSVGDCEASELPARVEAVIGIARRSCRKLATMAALSGVRR